MAQAPITTIPPFSDPAILPECAKLCGSLYDVNGACVPPGGPEADAAVYTSCFCADARVAAFSRGPTGVCDNACPDQSGLQSIANWFQGICTPAADNRGGGADTDNGAANNAAAGGTKKEPAGSSSNSNAGGGGDWLSHHWKWVVMLVVLVVAIAGIWIGACIWRRRYMRKRDRQTYLGQKHSGSASNPSWGPAITGSESATPMTFPRDTERAFSEKPRKTKEKKKWTVTQRT